MRIIFAGTPDFSTGVLEALNQAGHTIVGVYTQPDRPKGRGRVLTACPVKKKALALGLKVFQPDNLQDTNVQHTLKNLNAEVMVVVAYGQILPIEVLQMPHHGCLNIHASLLPRWRGAAPIQRAILAGDTTTGISIMQMDAGLDTGAVLLEKTCDISPTDTAQTLHDKLAILGTQGIIEALDKLKHLTPTIQTTTGISYAKKLTKDEAWIDWSKSAMTINQQIRAFNPYPIAQTNATSDKFESKTLRILSASVVANASPNKPGQIINSTKGTCLVATGNGALSLESVQLSGKKISTIKDFSNAYQLTKLQ